MDSTWGDSDPPHKECKADGEDFAEETGLSQSPQRRPGQVGRTPVHFLYTVKMAAKIL